MALTFQNVTSVALGSVPDGGQWGHVTVCDFDRDGWPDLILGRHGDSTEAYPEDLTDSPYGLLFYKNNRNGTFARVESTYFPALVANVSEHYHCAVVADVDGDGYEEIWIVTGYRDNSTDTVGYPDHVFKTNTVPFTDIAPTWGIQNFASKGASITALPGVPFGGDVGTMAILLANGEPNVTVGQLPRWNLIRREAGTWTIHTNTDLGFQFFADFLWTRAGSGDIPYGLQAVKQGSVWLIRNSSVNSNVWMRWDPSTGTLNGIWQGLDGFPTMAALSPYMIDGEWADVNEDGIPDWIAADIGAGDAGTGFDIPEGVRVYLTDPTSLFPQSSVTPTNDPAVQNVPGYPTTAYQARFWQSVPIGPNAEDRALVAADFDNDGHLDIFMMVSRGALVGGLSARGPNLLLKGNGDGTFNNITGSGVPGYEYLNSTTAPYAGGVAVIDFNMDGKLDLAVGYNSGGSAVLRGVGPFAVYQNVTPDAGHFVGFLLPIGKEIGATVTINGRSEQVTARTGWMRQSQRVVHRGLGASTAPVSVTVTLVDGTVLASGTVAPDHYYSVTQNSFVQF